MAEPCMICGDEIGKEVICDDCLRTSNARPCLKHDILVWKGGDCPMCVLDIPDTEYYMGTYRIKNKLTSE